MALWLVRAGRYGERESFALEKKVVAIGWEELPDLSNISSREKLEELCWKTYPKSKPNTIRNWVGQLWAFRERIHANDLVALPLKTRSAIAIGRVTGPYEYHTDFPADARHTRPVKWLRTDIPRAAFDQDLLYSLGAFITVCQIKRNNAEKRVEGILAGKPLKIEKRATDESEEKLDFEQTALDQIREYVGQNFRGHDLTQLVNSLLKAQGYRTLISPAGPDGGVDIIAGHGPMGFDSPRICVQVKSSDSPLEVSVLREFQAVVKNFGADRGLLVSWGGFKSSVDKEARQHFFEIRLWDADDLLKALLENYQQLPADVQADLPLKRVWALVPEEPEE